MLPHSLTRNLGPIVSKLTIYSFYFYYYIIVRDSFTISQKYFAYLTIPSVISCIRLLFAFMSQLNICTSDFTKVDMRENTDLTHGVILHNFEVIEKTEIKLLRWSLWGLKI